MALNSTKYPNISRIVSGTAVLFQNDSIILCDTSTGAVSMTLLEIPSGYWQTTWKLYVLDNNNNAGTNNITINAPSGYTINNAATLVINTNGGGVTITIASNTAFFGQVSPLPSGGGGSVTGVSASLPLLSSGGATPDISLPAATGSQDGFLTSGNWTSFNSRVVSVSATLPMTATAGVNPVVAMPPSSASADGYLTKGDWTNFNNKSEKVAASNTGGTIVAACTNFKFDTTYFNVTNPSGTIAAITPVLLPMMKAQETPANLSSVAAGFANTMFTDGVIQLISEIYDDGNDYDPATGIWTCPADGRYNLNCYAHYTLNDGVDGWFDPTTATASVTVTVPNPLPLGGVNYTTNDIITHGMFSIGILTPFANNQYCGAWISITQKLKHLDITASATGMDLTAGLQLCVKVLNQTGINYTSYSGDAVRFAIQRIK